MPKNVLKFVCPFCFEEVYYKDIEYRCTYKECKDRKDDEKLIKYWGKGWGTNWGGDSKKELTKANVFPGKGGFFSAFGAGKLPVCPKCHHATVRVCPKCHNTLPDSTIDGKDNIISVVGTRSSGKSHYIGVLINELDNRVAPAFGASLMGFIDPAGTYNANLIYRMKKKDPLYDKRQILELTHTNSGQGYVGEEDKVPLIYTWNYVRKPKGLPKAFTLSFMDAAGEDLEDAVKMEASNRYIANSKGVILLIDPLQITEVRELLDAEGVDYKNSTGDVPSSPAREVIENVTSRIRRARNIPEGKEIDIPVAIAFSKFDVIQPIAQHARTLQKKSGSPHADAGYFVSSDCENVDAEIRSLLEEWGEAALITQIESNYFEAAFFAVSALGLKNEPGEKIKVFDEKGNLQGTSRRIKRPHPFRVEDPLLWIMVQDDLLA